MEAVAVAMVVAVVVTVVASVVAVTVVASVVAVVAVVVVAVAVAVAARTMVITGMPSSEKDAAADERGSCTLTLSLHSWVRHLRWMARSGRLTTSWHGRWRPPCRLMMP